MKLISLCLVMFTAAFTSKLNAQSNFVWVNSDPFWIKYECPSLISNNSITIFSSDSTNIVTVEGNLSILENLPASHGDECTKAKQAFPYFSFICGKLTEGILVDNGGIVVGCDGSLDRVCVIASKY